MFFYKNSYEFLKKKNLQNIIVVQMYEIMKIQMFFQSNYDLIFLLIIFYRCVDLGKKIKNENEIFSFGQNMKNIIMVKIEYFCMG